MNTTLDIAVWCPAWKCLGYASFSSFCTWTPGHHLIFTGRYHYVKLLNTKQCSRLSTEISQHDQSMSKILKQTTQKAPLSKCKKASQTDPHLVNCLSSLPSSSQGFIYYIWHLFPNQYWAKIYQGSPD